MLRWLFILALTALPGLLGCSKPMVTPLIFQGGQVDPFDHAVDEQNPNKLRIFFATDAEYTVNKNVYEFNRRRADQLRVGHSDLRFGPDNAWPSIVASVSGQPGGKRYIPTVQKTKLYGHLDQPVGQADDQETTAQDRFIQGLNQVLAQSTGKAVTIYIHGFNTGFYKAIKTTAEYDLYTGGLGPFILYSWPSYVSLLEYSHDRDSVRFTATHARELVAMLADEINAGRLDATTINLIAHSTGAEVVGTVLRELALLSHGESAAQRQSRWRIGSVVLVSPDVSVDVARARLLNEDTDGMYRQANIYTSERDRALRWASWVLYRTPRLGALSEEDLKAADRRVLRGAQKIAIIDVDSKPYGGIVHHSHHRFSPEVASDIIMSLRSDLAPAERGLSRGEGDVLWRFPEDYESRATQAAVKIYNKANDDD